MWTWRSGLAALWLGVACAGGGDGEDAGSEDGEAPVVCAEPETLCGRQCVALDVHPNHCGECFRSCGISEGAATACEDGTCLCGDSDVTCEGTPDDSCCVTEEGAGACVSLLTDEANCGVCGAPCGAPATNLCRFGQCTCGVPSTAAVDATACPEGQECCGEGPDAFCVTEGSCERGG